MRSLTPPRARFANALAKFWAPVPWLLEAAIVLQVVLHKDLEAPASMGSDSPVSIN